ncbi:14747_t:CDS:2, partial [Gigaspora rosea]
YGLYVKKYAKTKGWNDLLYEVCPDIKLVQTKAFLNKLQFQEGINNIVKIFCKIVDSNQFIPNNLLLLEVLGIQYIGVNYKKLKIAYQSEKIWNELNKDIQIQDLPNHLKVFIEESKKLNYLSFSSKDHIIII